MKKPAFQFYPGDWRKDQNLSRASLQAKGAMIEIMCLAFECDKRGVLTTDGRPWSIDEIAFAMGGDKEQNILAIEELLSKKILKKTKKGAIFSKRMVKDEELSKVRRRAGLNGGNPVLVKQKDKQDANQKPTPSSSSSSSTSVKRQSAAIFDDPFFQMFRRATGLHITNEELVEEVGKFKNKYPNLHANQAGPLINGWVSRIGQQQFVPEVKPNIVV
jgi:hypothetical protein